MSNRTKILLVVVGVLAVGAAAFLLVNRTTSQKANPVFGKLPPPTLEGSANLSNRSIEIGLKSREETQKLLAVYKLEKRTLSISEAKNLAKKFGFENEPQGKDVLLWKVGKQTLSIKLSPPKLEFTDFNVGGAGQISNKDGLVDKAEVFLQEKGLIKDDLLVDRANTRAYTAKGNELFLAPNQAEEAILEVGFNRMVDSFPVLFSDPTMPAATVLLNENGEIFKLIYLDFGTTTDSGQYPIVQRKEIGTEKIASLGTLVYPKIGDTIFDPSLIRKFVIEDASLCYLDDQVSAYFTPIYVLRGSAQAGKETTPVVIYLPAVSVGWFK